MWAHYGKAHWHHRVREYPAARESVLAAFELDPGHMPTMRLHASMQAAAGEIPPATECLLTWLKRGETDPMIDARERTEGQVDLAALPGAGRSRGRRAGTAGRDRPLLVA